MKNQMRVMHLSTTSSQCVLSEASCSASKRDILRSKRSFLMLSTHLVTGRPLGFCISVLLRLLICLDSALSLSHKHTHNMMVFDPLSGDGGGGGLPPIPTSLIGPHTPPLSPVRHKGMAHALPLSLDSRYPSKPAARSLYQYLTSAILVTA